MNVPVARHAAFSRWHPSEHAAKPHRLCGASQLLEKGIVVLLRVQPSATGKKVRAAEMTDDDGRGREDKERKRRLERKVSLRDRGLVRHRRLRAVQVVPQLTKSVRHQSVGGGGYERLGGFFSIDP